LCDCETKQLTARWHPHFLQIRLVTLQVAANLLRLLTVAPAPPAIPAAAAAVAPPDGALAGSGGDVTQARPRYLLTEKHAAEIKVYGSSGDRALRAAPEPSPPAMGIAHVIRMHGASRHHDTHPDTRATLRRSLKGFRAGSCEIFTLQRQLEVTWQRRASWMYLMVSV